MDSNLRDSQVEFLKSFTKVIVHGSLYSDDHPQVKASAADIIAKLKNLLRLLGKDEVFLTISDNKFLLDGNQLMGIDKLPNSILNIYRQCRVDTIIISGAVSQNEIIKFSKIAASKKDPDVFISENSIKNIKLSKNVYVKSDGKKAAALPDTSSVISLESDIQNQNFIESLKSIVSKLTDDSKLQQRIIENLIKKFKQEVESAIEKAVKEVNIERN
jgi:hypothetical protein